jgi:ribose transport system permease protein
LSALRRRRETTADLRQQTFTERLEPYIAIIGPMVMIFAILLFMGVAEPARYFRATNLNADPA